ncbi:MAG: hypothetical protein ACUVTX_04880 [Bacteroidales bacterium]
MKAIIDRLKTLKFLTTLLLVLLVLIFIKSCSDEPVVMPILTTLAVNPDNVTRSSAILKGRIIYLGNARIIEYGIELSKNQLFAPSDTNGIKSAPDTGIFAIEFKNLDPGTLYYFKAYVVINTAQFYSQNVERFTTKVK